MAKLGEIVYLSVNNFRFEGVLEPLVKRPAFAGRQAQRRMIGRGFRLRPLPTGQAKYLLFFDFSAPINC